MKRASPNYVRNRNKIAPREDAAVVSDSEAEKVDDASERERPQRATAYHLFMASQHPSKPDMPKEGNKTESLSKYNREMKKCFDALASDDVAAFQAAADAKNAVMDSPREKLARRALSVFLYDLHGSDADLHQMRGEDVENYGITAAQVDGGRRLACICACGRIGC